jgi:response regulator RpfG family c-di-GMP phosphodiesterase
MSERILFVDDEPNVLEGIQRTLRKQANLHVASSGADGLRLLTDSGPFALVISDMRMPLMSGAQFLAKVRAQAPDTVRMILSGQADLQATIEAVNDGHIFRFLTKPCPSDQLIGAIEDGIKQYRLLTAEKVLLEQTLNGSVQMLIEILGLVQPAASSRASRLRRYVVELTAALALPERWQWALAALVSQIGCVALPKEIMSKVEAGQTLNDEERRLHDSHPEIAGKLLAAIPRLEDVAAIVTAQFADVAWTGQSEDVRQWDIRSAGRLLLRCAFEFDCLTTRGVSRDAAINALRTSRLGFPRSIIKALSSLPRTSLECIVRQVRLKDLAVGMTLDEDLVSPKGIRLVPMGQEVTRTLIVRLTSIAGGVGIAEPFRVRVPT